MTRPRLAGLLPVSIVSFTFACLALLGVGSVFAGNGGPPPFGGTLTVSGSVEQMYIAHADPNAPVNISGPGGFSFDGTTDDWGGLVLRDVPAGSDYQVVLGGPRGGGFSIDVLAPGDHPSASFYSAQTLDPSTGYFETRDGTLLAYQVVLPDPDVFGPGPYPVVIDYSAYRPSINFFDGVGSRFPALGYAAVGVNMRGSACSGGSFDYFEQIQAIDGYDMVEVLAAQDWSDGIALIGKSYPGISQLFVAATRPPSLNAIVPGHVIGEFYRDVAYPGGVLNFAFAAVFSQDQDERSAWPSSYSQVNERTDPSNPLFDPVCLENQALRLQNVSMEAGIFGNPYDGAYWQGRAPETLVGDIAVPTLLVNAWQDEQTGSGPAKLLERFDPNVPARLLGMNGDHGEYFRGDIWAEVVRFLDVYLGESTAAEVAAYEAEPPVEILLEVDRDGIAASRFSLPSFEAAGSGRRWWMESGSLFSTPAAENDTSSFNYDPPGLLDFAGGWMMPGQNQWMPPLQDRATFTSAPLDSQLVMAGSGSVDLWVASSEPAVDLEVTLTEIRPDGTEMLVQSGWLRTSARALDGSSTALRPRHTHRVEDELPLDPAGFVPVRVELFPFAHVFRADSRIRVTVDGPGGNRWRWGFAPIPGGSDAEVIIAHGPDHPSSVVLPVVGAAVDAGDYPDCSPAEFSSAVSSQPCREATGLPGPEADRLPPPAVPVPVAGPVFVALLSLLMLLTGLFGQRLYWRRG
ncbi:MAG: CocE/NonD family hydrolase [Wenzhouxiangella sp.]|nr:MAG: CocE/NonD family hydrolase [Wenzhouxiangella sp.]